MKLTESQLRKVIRKVVNEQADTITHEKEAGMLLDYAIDRGWQCDDIDQFIDWDEFASMVGKKYSHDQSTELIIKAVMLHIDSDFAPQNY